MIVAPIPGTLEPALPDAKGSLPGGRLFAPVIASGNRQAFGHHDLADIGALNGTPGKQALVAIGNFGAAVDLAAGQKCGEPLPRGLPAGPCGAGAVGALLGQFGRVEPQQPDAAVGQPEAVAVGRPCVARNRWRGRIEKGDQPCEGGKNGDCGQSATPASKKAASVRMSSQDFTTR